MLSELTTFRFDDNQPEYTPHNFNNQYANGQITMAQALALSDNVYAVKTHLFLGEKTLVDTAKTVWHYDRNGGMFLLLHSEPLVFE